MNWVIIVLAFLAVLFFLKNLKHHLIRKLITFGFVVLFILVFFVFVSYLDLGSILGRESIFAKTGAAVVDTVSEVDASSLFSGVKDSVANISGATPSFSDAGSFDFLKVSE